MKNLLLALFLLPAPSFAAVDLNPPCDGMGCTPKMQSIADAFVAGTTIEAATLPLLASGECYHLANYYNPETTHHGVVLLDPHEGNVYMGGLFSFFTPENPYKDWTLEKARAQSTNLYADNHKVELTSKFAFSDMNANGSELRLYWLKRDATHLYVIGQWSTQQRMYCELSFQ